MSGTNIRPCSADRDEDVAAQDHECIRILRAYINLCSMPMHGPQSGALVWVTPQEAQRALAYLERSRV